MIQSPKRQTARHQIDSGIRECASAVQVSAVVAISIVLSCHNGMEYQRKTQWDYDLEAQNVPT